ncbi:MAG: DUF4249 domain-containing protein [Bacteroidota bacterium]
MNKQLLQYLPLFLLAVLLSACEQEFIPELPDQPEELVVEGYIEAGELALPPYVILTRSLPFFTELPANELSSLFIHDAEVIVTHNGRETLFEEICWSDFDEDEQEVLSRILQTLGVFEEGVEFDFCVYVDPDFALTGTIGERYDLTVTIGEEVLTSTTTIPPHVLLDSLFFIQPTGDVPDTLRELRGLVQDPGDRADFYRYLVSNNGSLFESGFTSVADDLFFNGQRFEFPIPNSEPRNEDPDPRTFGLYVVGDTTTIRWSNIDEPHFRFWSTLEFNNVNQGPFSSYTRVDGNIEGGLGIWGGYSLSYYSLIVE